MAELDAGPQENLEHAKGLDAILDQALENYGEPEKPDTPGDAPVKAAEPTDASRARGVDGKFLAKESAEPKPSTENAEVSAKTAEPAKADPAPQPVEPHPRWPAELKAAFASWPPDVQKAFRERDGATEAEYTRKTQEVAEQRKQFAPVLSEVEKWSPYFQQQGLSPGQAISKLIQAEYTLRNGTPAQRQAMFAQLAHDYQVSAIGQQNPVAHSQTDPAVAELKQQLSGLQDYIETTEQQKLKSEIDAFSQAKDQSGQLLRPHFERVRETMGRLLDSGQATDLDAAYAKAVRLDDDLFKQTVESERKRVTDEAERARQEAVDKAKKAQPTRSSDGNPSGAATRKGLDAHLDAALEQFGS